MMMVMNSKEKKQAEALAALSAADRARLDRLAALSGSSPEEIWPAVYRYGLDDMEESVKAGIDAEAEHAAGRTIPHEEVMANALCLIDDHDRQRKLRTG
jgi:predicted transcriptional regulator